LTPDRFFTCWQDSARDVAAVGHFGDVRSRNLDARTGGWRLAVVRLLWVRPDGSHRSCECGCDRKVPAGADRRPAVRLEIAKDARPADRPTSADGHARRRRATAVATELATTLVAGGEVTQTTVAATRRKRLRRCG
jgi:hypothetical protein